MQNPQLDKDRQTIAERIRGLRQARGLTQAALAKQLGLSQNRLSEIERGSGSFTAEQFLRILRVFNVGAAEFVPHKRDRDRGLEVQNALARLGAAQLQESAHVLPSEELQEVHDVVREALVLGEPRLVTAVAPVLVAHAERLNLSRLHADQFLRSSWRCSAGPWHTCSICGARTRLGTRYTPLSHGLAASSWLSGYSRRTATPASSAPELVQVRQRAGRRRQTADAFSACAALPSLAAARGPHPDVLDRRRTREQPERRRGQTRALLRASRSRVPRRPRRFQGAARVRKV